MKGAQIIPVDLSWFLRMMLIIAYLEKILFLYDIIVVNAPNPAIHFAAMGAQSIHAMI